MSRKLIAGTLVVLLTGFLSTGVFAQKGPSAVQGSITSVGENNANIGVTFKNTEVKVPVTPTTRYALDDVASDFANAIVVGRDVDIIMSDDGNAFIVMASTVQTKGTVKSAAAGAIVVTTKKGVDTTVKVGPDTKYILGKATSTLEAAAAEGNTVTIDLGPGGIATTVTAKAAKAPKTPKTPATPATPTLPPAGGN